MQPREVYCISYHPYLNVQLFLLKPHLTINFMNSSPQKSLFLSKISIAKSVPELPTVSIGRLLAPTAPSLRLENTRSSRKPWRSTKSLKRMGKLSVSSELTIRLTSH